MRPLPIANPPNPWASSVTQWLDEPPAIGLEVYEDRSKSILSKNDSPDLPFTFSANPYRGCMHGCAYCYARPTHEFLGFGSGTDFERRIVIKKDAPELLRRALRSRRYEREPVLFSGATDCYQPLEASCGLMRRCLHVCLEEQAPVMVITKSPLIERDAELLARLSRGPGVRVTISIPFFDKEHARAIEPYVATPARRFKTIHNLARAGVPVGVNVAPVIPGLSDEQIPRILAAAKQAGAQWAAWVMLRLPGSVKEVFESRIRAAFPLRADKILARLAETHGGKLYDARFGAPRMRGHGPYADAVDLLFQRTCEKLGFSPPPALGSAPAAQLGLFSEQM